MTQILTLATPLEGPRGRIDRLTFRAPTWADWEELSPVERLAISPEGFASIMLDLASAGRWARRLCTDHPEQVARVTGAADIAALEALIVGFLPRLGPISPDATPLPAPPIATTGAPTSNAPPSPASVSPVGDPPISIV